MYIYMHIFFLVFVEFRVSKLVNILARLVLIYWLVDRLIVFLSSVARFIAIAMGKGCLWVLDLSGAGLSPSGFSIFFFPPKNGG